MYLKVEVIQAYSVSRQVSSRKSNLKLEQELSDGNKSQRRKDTIIAA